MKYSALIALTVAAPLAFAAEGPHGSRNSEPTSPVLRALEPTDSSVFQLPGPAPVTPAIRLVKVAAPAPSASPLPANLVLSSLPPLPKIPVRPKVPVPAPAANPGEPPPKPALPAEAASDVAFYCQKRSGRWTDLEARQLLGSPLRSRPAFDEQKKPNGKIYAFNDPSNRYRELELDFDSSSGALRTVFVYPQKMTWQEVQRRWRGDVSAADAPQGRKFYSYTNRRLDVLVDAEGRVISLGLY
jgi:hypothetical protein